MRGSEATSSSDDVFAHGREANGATPTSVSADRANKGSSPKRRKAHGRRGIKPGESIARARRILTQHPEITTGELRRHAADAADHCHHLQALQDLLKRPRTVIRHLWPTSQPCWPRGRAACSAGSCRATTPRDHEVYLTYYAPEEGGAGLALAWAKLVHRRISRRSDGFLSGPRREGSEAARPPTSDAHAQIPRR